MTFWVLLALSATNDVAMPLVAIMIQVSMGKIRTSKKISTNSGALKGDGIFPVRDLKLKHHQFFRHNSNPSPSCHPCLQQKARKSLAS